MATDAPTHPAMAVVDKMYDCFAKGDMATLKTDVFAPDIAWNLPGHHPLSGIKNGPDEVIAFFGALMQTGHRRRQHHLRHDGRRPASSRSTPGTAT